MTHAEILRKAQTVEESGGSQMTLDVGSRKRPGYRVRITPHSGPLGELLCINAQERCVATFSAAAVARWARIEMAKSAEMESLL